MIIYQKKKKKKKKKRVEQKQKQIQKSIIIDRPFSTRETMSSRGHQAPKSYYVFPSFDDDENYDK